MAGGGLFLLYVTNLMLSKFEFGVGVCWMFAIIGPLFSLLALLFGSVLENLRRPG